jgi:integrase
MPLVRCTVAEATAKFLDGVEGEYNTIKNKRASFKPLNRLYGHLLVPSLEPRHMDDVFGSKRNDWKSKGTRRIHHGNYLEWMAWCRDRHYAAWDWNPMAGRKAPKSPPPKRHKYYSRQEFWNVAENYALDIQDEVTVLWNYETMMRVGEFTQLRVGDLSPNLRMVGVDVPKTGDFDPTLPIRERLRTKLRLYLDIYEERLAETGIKLSDSHFLFPSRVPCPNAVRAEGHMVIEYPHGPMLMRLRPNKPLSVGQTLNNFRAAWLSAGYPEDRTYGGHNGRRSGSHNMVRALWLKDWEELGIPAEQVQDMTIDSAIGIVKEFLHHSKLATTEIYTGNLISRAMRDMMFNPWGDDDPDLPPGVVDLSQFRTASA